MAKTYPPQKLTDDDLLQATGGGTIYADSTEYMGILSTCVRKKSKDSCGTDERCECSKEQKRCVISDDYKIHNAR